MLTEEKVKDRLVTVPMATFAAPFLAKVYRSCHTLCSGWPLLLLLDSSSDEHGDRDHMPESLKYLLSGP